MAKGTLTIQVRAGAMMSMEANTALKLARAALATGYDVKIFGYGEGVTCIKNGMGPKRFPNVGNELGELAAKGVAVTVCETCSTARGLRKGEEVPGTRIGTLTKDLSEYVAASDRLVTLAR